MLAQLTTELLAVGVPQTMTPLRLKDQKRGSGKGNEGRPLRASLPHAKDRILQLRCRHLVWSRPR